MSISESTVAEMRLGIQLICLYISYSGLLFFFIIIFFIFYPLGEKLLSIRICSMTWVQVIKQKQIYNLSVSM